MAFDPGLSTYARTARQKEIIAAIDACGGNKAAAARSLNVTVESVKSIYNSVKAHAAKAGYIPETGRTVEVPPHLALDGISNFRDMETGEVTRRWEKMNLDRELQIQSILDAIQETSRGIKPYKRIRAPKARLAKDLNTLITLSDVHVGELSWDKESGADYDCKLAEGACKGVVADLCDLTPDSELATLNILGDFFHYEKMQSETSRSGHVIDADSRPGKLIATSIDIVSWSIAHLLERFKRVQVYLMPGNHDEWAMLSMRLHFAHFFKGNPRVQVWTGKNPFAAYLHGKTMVAFNHGDRIKLRDLPSVFASDPEFRPMWGEATKTYIHCGHLHKEEKDELNGAIVERHPTVAARNSYATGLGLHSIRAAKASVYHTELGRIMETYAYPEAA